MAAAAACCVLLRILLCCALKGRFLFCSVLVQVHACFFGKKEGRMNVHSAFELHHTYIHTSNAPRVQAAVETVRVVLKKNETSQC